MWFLEQVAIICLAQFIMIPSAHTTPQAFFNNNQGKGNNKHASKNYLTSVQEAKDFKNSDTDRESILKAFNFHDIEYPVAASPRPQQNYFQDFNDNPSPQRSFMSDANDIKMNSDLKPPRNRTSKNLQNLGKSIQNNANIPSGLFLPKEFTIGSDFRDVGNFPEVEYPLSAKELWKPNYWSIPSGSKDINAFLSEDSNIKQNLNIYPKTNSRIGSKSGKCRSFSTKSYSDIIKNKERLKQVIKNKASNNTNLKQKNSTCRNDFTVNSEEKFAANNIKTLPIENTEQDFFTTAIPYYFTPIDTSPGCEEINKDFSHTFSVFNESYQNQNKLSIPFQTALIPKVIETNNSFINNHALDFEEKSTKLLKHSNNREDVSSNKVQEMNLYDIIGVRKPETGSDLCGLDEDYTTDIYSEENNIGWFSQSTTTPTPFSATTDDLKWKNCKVITPCEYKVDELEDYYISV